MGKQLNIITSLHNRTKREYLPRMIDDKISCMEVAKRYDHHFWDGDRKFGYGGYTYDGRWESVARKLIDEYSISNGDRILDVGCGKGFLLYEFKKLLPDSVISGFDISTYALEHAKEEIKGNLFFHNAEETFPFKDLEFDLVISLTTLHNLSVQFLVRALNEIERVGKNKYLVVESYRSNQELFNLQCWALTCESFFQPEEWAWIYKHSGYTGDFEYIFFE